uniref:Uncharacterized protein n=2 Tax=Meloidogyne TaxID=189290 RepID=A0A6V7USX1_MELEN|nr:unnamed protein product [Meloidogyne enterolobii]
MAFSCKSAVCRDRHSTFETTKKPLLSAIFGSSSSFCLLAIFILPFLLFSSESTSAATISPITGEETEMRHQQQNHQRRQQNNDDEDDGRAVGTGRKCEIKVHIVKHVRGECVRLFGGKPACQSEEYVDPESEQCRNEEPIFLRK